MKILYITKSEKRVREFKDIIKKHKDAIVTIDSLFDLEYDVPKDWTREQIIEDIKENLDDFTWYNEEIEDIEV